VTEANDSDVMGATLHIRCVVEVPSLPLWKIIHVKVISIFP